MALVMDGRYLAVEQLDRLDVKVVVAKRVAPPAVAVVCALPVPPIVVGPL